MKDSNKLYYLDRKTDSKRNVPFDNNPRLLHTKGYGASITHTIGCYEHNNKWIERGTQRVLHPYAWSYLTKFIEEPAEETEDIPGFGGTMDSFPSLLKGKDNVRRNN